MAGAATGRMSWWPGRVLGPAVLACGLLGACGSTPSAPTTPEPTPTVPAPSPEPASGGFLHVLQDGSVVTYKIDAATGQLSQSATQRVGGAALMMDAPLIAGEPQGRYVFAAYGAYYPEQHASIVAYAPDPLSGSLMTLSEADYGLGSHWYWLFATSTRVYAMKVFFTGHTYPSLVSHAVESEGQLGPAAIRSFERDAGPAVALDIESDPNVFYASTSTGGLTAHFVEPDGGLTRMGGSHLCVASTLDYAIPLVAARGFLFASANLAGPSAEVVCSWEGPRLAPRANLGLQSNYAVALAPRDVSSAWSSSAASRP